MELLIEHRASAHCENGTISALLRYHGVDLSEPMIFGLASGLFFAHLPFVKMSGMPVTAFRTFPGVLFSRIMKMLGISTKTVRFLNKENAMRQLDKVLKEKKEPVGCVVGMYYLPYMPMEYRFHFNGHNICIVGKDETTEKYTVLDSNATQKVFISRKDLIKVRFAKGGTYPLLGQMYYITKMPDQIPDLNPLIIKSIHKTCRNMIRYPNFVTIAGTNGILSLSKRIRKWEKTLGHRNALLNLAQLVRMSEEIGTGGAGFRFMYGAFLQEASLRLGIKELNDYAMQITEIGDLWREMAFMASRIFKKREGDNYTFDDLGDLLERIATLEKNFFKDLDQFVIQYH